MRKSILIGACILLLGGCATAPTTFGAANSEKSYGFQTTKIESDRYRVSYTARTDIEAYDYALLRAAQLAHDEGYSHFKVIQGSTVDNGPPARVSTSVGFGTGSYYGRSRSSVGLGINIGDLARALEGDKVTHIMEVRLLDADEEAPNIYNAQGIKDNIRPAAFK